MHLQMRQCLIDSWLVVTSRNYCLIFSTLIKITYALTPKQSTAKTNRIKNELINVRGEREKMFTSFFLAIGKFSHSALWSGIMKMTTRENTLFDVSSILSVRFCDPFDLMHDKPKMTAVGDCNSCELQLMFALACSLTTNGTGFHQKRAEKSNRLRSLDDHRRNARK